MDHIQLICDIGELNEIFTDAQSIEAFLQKIVEMVAKHMDAAVCSVYLYEEDKNDLVLRATQGLTKESVGKIRLKLGEGLAGLALKERRPISEKVGKEHPNFKFFPGSTEERYDAFLAVPIFRALSKIGVLVVQRPKSKAFKERDVVILRAVASQLANMLENARLFMTMKVNPAGADKKNTRQLKLQKGKIASDGFAFGPARIIDRDKTFESFFNRKYKGTYTLSDFKKAIALTVHQLEDLQARVEEKLSDVASLIFTAHLLLLKDKEFVGSMTRKIEEGVSPPDAIILIARHYIEIFSRGTNAYIKEKVQDIEDLSIRLLGNLVAEFRDLCQCENHIIIARELFPSDILKLSSENVLGVVLVTGGVTSHLSILARSLKIPILIVDSSRLLSIPDETTVLLDAEVGNFYINPSPTIIASFHERNESRKRIKAKNILVRPQTFTNDGVRLKLMASINLLSDLKLANEVLSEGVGLYRTEFPFLIRNDFPSEEEQFVVYRQLVDGMPNKEITFRTLDIGGDKMLSYYDLAREQNPFLGMRSIRFSLSNKEVFVQQIRAMLRAGAGANIRIMFPMISSLEEYLEAKSAIVECISSLKEKKIPHNANPQIGIMIEVPSVIPIMDNLAAEADFFSIGTNDLVQYMLAVDRTNEKVAGYYIPHHPAILRVIKTAVDVARTFGKRISICGDMAHNEKYLPFFLGLGVSELSIEASYIPRIQEAVSKVDSSDAAVMVSEIMALRKTADILRMLK
jgi:phosphotransferase system enzyme I (PtsP)